MDYSAHLSATGPILPPSAPPTPQPPPPPGSLAAFPGGLYGLYPPPMPPPIPTGELILEQ